MHSPGLEPGSTGWKPVIIPLDQECFHYSYILYFLNELINHFAKAIFRFSSNILFKFNLSDYGLHIRYINVNKAHIKYK